jgi:ABC-type branched-subunit amino acid transport system substrate-binding protein
MVGLAVLALAVAACGSSSKVSNGKASGKLTFVTFAPFSGADAAFGASKVAGIIPGVYAIAHGGGILGDTTVKWMESDSRGDPADAVPIAQKLLLTTPSIVGIIGPTSDESTATVPIFDRAHIPTFALTGQIAFNTNSYQYFWRITPPDNDVGIAMAQYAHDKGYTKAALVFGTDIGSTGAVPSLLKAWQHLGGTVVANESLPLDQSSYQSEVAKVAAAHPQVIFFEADAQTSATYMTELNQMHGLVPFIGTDGTTVPSWTVPVAKAVGPANFDKYYVGAQPYLATSGPSFAAWQSAFNAVKSQEPKPADQWLNSSFAIAGYDGAITMALAMDASKSTAPKVFNAYIPKVTSASPGAVVVHSYSAGRQALAQGKTIQYIGATGVIAFDKYHNSPGGFEIINSKYKFITAYTSAQIASLSTASGANGVR